ncbi:response regulator [Candidatus Pelagadaptatus aseana]|uniref:response regulator n=1 Tax=Candidatus Pelagadaptatus aseana TaxID=3120508 RepID=UPI003C6FAC3C
MEPSLIPFLLLLTLVMLFIMAITNINRNGSASNRDKHFNSKRRRNAILSLNALLVATILSLSYVGLERIQQREQNSYRWILSAVLETTNQGLQIWANNNLKQLLTIAERPAIVDLTQALLEEHKDGKNLVHSTQRTRIRDYLQIHNPTLAASYSLVSANYINIASYDESVLGNINLIADKYRHLLARVLWGQPQFIPPIQFAPDHRRKDSPVAFFAAPIKDANGQSVAILIQHIDPSLEFSAIMAGGRVGDSGETYALNEDGVLISESRFTRALKQQGILEQDQSSILKLQADINAPTSQNQLTNMTKGITFKEAGTNVEGYPDYRGVKVIGTWLWNDELNLGLATEIDRNEAYDSYYFIRNALIILIALTLLMSIGSLTFSIRSSNRAGRELEQAKDNLEEQLHRRTEEIKDHEEQYLRLFESTRDAVILMTADRFLNCNSAATELLGYDLDELKLLGVEDVSPPTQPGGENSLELSRNYIKQALGKQKALFEWVHRHKDGTDFICEVLLQPAEWEDAEVIMAVIRDIRKRKANEHALQQSQERLNLAMSGANAGMWDWNAITGEFITNDIWCTMLGFTDQELVHEYGDSHNRWVKLIHPEDREEAVNALQNHVLGMSDAYHDEFRMRTKSGEYKWILCVGKAFERNSDNAANRVLGIHLDIDETKQLQQALGKEKQRVDVILNATPDPILVVQTQGTILDANQACSQTLGYSHAELIGKPLEALLSAKASSNQSNRLERLLEGKDKHSGQRLDFKIQNKRGDELIIEVKLSSIFFDNEDLLIVGLHDVTLEREAEQSLLEAKRMADDANNAKSNFLANMSHEIRTPMNAIIGMSHLALQSDLNRKQRGYISKVHRSAESLLGIINDILDFSKIESGKLDMEFTNFRLEDVMDNLSNLIGLKAEESDLELNFNVEPDVPTALKGDPMRLGQILLNLGNNAIKFSNSGDEVLINVKLENRFDNKAILEFSVHDTGIGMNRKQTDKLFKSFSQADSSTTRKYGGTGLGLVICQRLTEMMGGKIWAHSEEQSGSTFYFTAQFVLQDAQPHLAIPPTSNLGSPKVLIVDDNDTSRNILQQILVRFGFRVEQSSSAKDALEQLSNRHNLDDQLLLIDWKMPQCNGIELIRDIRHQYGDELQIVLMTPLYSSEEAIEISHDVKIQGFLSKPLTASNVLDTVLLALGKETVNDAYHEERQGHPSEPIRKLSGARILLVEDNEINQDLALELLRSNGILATLAEDGQQAIEKLQQDEFDGVLMDCQMPVMDGYTATQKIREDERFRSLPIIAMTANAMAGDKEKVLAVGMNDHIAKPINVQDMFNTMARWITPSRSAPISATARAEHLEPVNLPDNLPGIDIQGGLKTAQNNPALFGKLLRRFATHYQNFESDFNQSKTDQNSAIRSAHTLKGTAGNIGAYQVQEAALKLEQSCRSNKADVAKELGAVTDTLRIVLDGLQPLLAESPSQKEHKPFDLPSTLLLISQLKELVDNYDTDANDMVYQLEPYLRGNEFEPYLQRLSEAIDSYDFDEAQGVLIELSTALENRH